MSVTTTARELSDGSTCVVEATGFRSAVVSRFVDGVCVWAQAFSTGPDLNRAADCIDAMIADPAGFERPWCTRCGSGAHLTGQHI